MHNQVAWHDVVRLAAGLGIQPCALQAVQMVASGGKNGLLPSGRPIIMFEGHIFWKTLQHRDMRPEELAPGAEDVLYPKWTKNHYKGGDREYDRLERAKAIHEEAALEAASWGAYQIMGFNYRHCGCESVREFAEAQNSIAGQLEAFCNLLEKMRLVSFIKDKDWDGYANAYHGPSYRDNQIDRKLVAVYASCLQQNDG